MGPSILAILFSLVDLACMDDEGHKGQHLVLPKETTKKVLLHIYNYIHHKLMQLTKAKSCIQGI